MYNIPGASLIFSTWEEQYNECPQNLLPTCACVIVPGKEIKSTANLEGFASLNRALLDNPGNVLYDHVEGKLMK